MGGVGETIGLVGTGLNFFGNIMGSSSRASQYEAQQQVYRQQLALQARGLDFEAFGFERSGTLQAESYFEQARGAIASANVALANAAMQEREAKVALSIGEYNNQIATINAEQTEDAMDRALVAFDRNADRFVGAQVAGYAAAGVDVGSGSPVQVVADTTDDLLLQRESISAQGINQIMSYKLQGGMALYQGQTLAERARNQAGIDRMLAGEYMRSSTALNRIGRVALDSAQEGAEYLRGSADIMRQMAGDVNTDGSGVFLGGVLGAFGGLGTGLYGTGVFG